MRTNRSLIIGMLLLCLTAIPIAAQGIPDAVQQAVNALDARLEDPINFETLAGFEWEDRVFDSAALGCPQPGQQYAQVVTDGYQVSLTYAGTTYDYRVSDAGDVILCTSFEAQPIESTVPAPPDAEPTPDNDCPATDPLPLEPNTQARTTPGLPSNIRSAANINADILGEVPPGTAFTVTGTSVCSNNFHWWQITYDGISGWIAQGAGGLLYIIPIPADVPSTANLAPITPDTIDQFQLLSQVFGNVQSTVAWSPDGAVLAIASSNPDDPGVWLYELTSLATPPRLVESTNAIQAVAFGPEGLLVTGDALGNVVFWNAVSEEQIASFQAYDEAVVDMRFNPTGTLLTTVSASRQISFWGVPR